jgi:hypothetical protein
MIMKAKFLIILSLLLGVFAVAAVIKTMEIPRAKFTVRVLNEQGLPMPDTVVTVVFMDPVTRKGIPQDGLTNKDGLYVAEGHTDGALGGTILREGYYRSGWPNVKFEEINNGRWEPWGETYTTYLRPVMSPVPMYAQRGWIEIPSTDTPCGYDLEKTIGFHHMEKVLLVT